MRQYRGELNPPPSALLLNAMYAVAARFDDDPSLRTDPDKPVTSGAIFFERAKMYLDRDYVHPRLSTVQALILISSHQNGVAEGSRSWLHAGMVCFISGVTESQSFCITGLNLKCEVWYRSSHYMTDVHIKLKSIITSILYV